MEEKEELYDDVYSSSMNRSINQNLLGTSSRPKSLSNGAYLVVLSLEEWERERRLYLDSEQRIDESPIFSTADNRCQARVWNTVPDEPLIDTCKGCIRSLVAAVKSLVSTS